MLTLVIELDEEEPLDADEALGCIEIRDGAGNGFREADVWVDDWLRALIEGTEILKSRTTVVHVEIDSEPYPLVLSNKAGGLSVGYKEMFGQGNSLTEFTNELKRVSREVIGQFGVEKVLENIAWRDILRYAGY
jgi:hypothetical protein